MVFRFLLRILLQFPRYLDDLEVPEGLCDLLRSQPHLLPSMLSVVRHAKSRPVQFKLLQSLGKFVSSLEPPSDLASPLPTSADALTQTIELMKQPENMAKMEVSAQG